MKKYILSIIGFILLCSVNLYSKEIMQITPSSKKLEVKFIIEDKIYDKNNELISLIFKTESMDDTERQYWFDIMPSMSKDQIKRLFDILDTERKKLEALEAQYQEEIKALNEKHLDKGERFQIKDTISKEKTIVLVKNPFDNKNILRYTLIEINNNNKDTIHEKIVLDFEDFNIREHQFDGAMFNQFIFYYVQKNFNQYYEIYQSQIFEILEVYYRNLFFQKILDDTHKEKFKLFEKYISKEEDKSRYKDLLHNIESKINSLNPNIDERIKFSIDREKNNISTDILFRMTYLLIGEDEALTKELLDLYVQRLSKDKYEYLKTYKKNLKSKKYTLEVHLIIVNLFVNKYNNTLDKTTKDELNTFINDCLANESYFANNHYFEMSKLLLRGNEKDLNETYQQLKNNFYANQTSDEAQANFLEYGSYIALKNYLDGNQYENYLNDMKRTVETIKMFSTAYQYIELDVVQFLSSLVQKQKIKEQARMETMQAKENTNRELFVMDCIRGAIILFAIGATTYIIIFFAFNSLILNNSGLICSFITVILMTRFKLIGYAAEKFILYRLKELLLKRLNTKIQNKQIQPDKHKFTEILDGLSSANYHEEKFLKYDESLVLSKDISVKLGLLPIIIKKDMELNIGCLNDILFKIGYTSYLFVIHFQNMENEHELLKLKDDIQTKYVDSKIVVFRGCINEFL